jgi:hypothetical protein
MNSDPNQEPVESSQLLAASEPTVYAVGTASSPASQLDESAPGQQRTSSEPTLSQGRMAPSQPSSRKTSRRSLWLSLVILVLVLVIAGAVTTTILLLVTSPSQAVNTVVQDYYNAVERQDYAMAYTYVNHQSGQFQTLAAYSKSSLSLDQTAGTLTAYTISSTSITNGIATVIVDRTRGGNTAEIFVEVQQIGGNWKVNAIVPGWSIPS